MREESKFIDWQKVKVQEKSDEVCSLLTLSSYSVCQLLFTACTRCSVFIES